MGRTKTTRLGDARDGEEESSTASLGDDALLQIFDHLPPRELLVSAAFVCRRWRRLCQSHVRELVPPDWLQADEFLALARKNAPTITNVHIPWWIRDAAKVVSSFPHLRHLECSFFTPDLALAMSPELETLTLHRKAGEPNSASFFHALRLQCPRLHKLKFHAFPSSSEHLVRSFSSSLTSLQIDCDSFTLRHVDEIFRCCLSLTNLCILSHHLDLNPDSAFDPDWDFDSLSPIPPRLLSLCLGHDLYHSIRYGPRSGWSVIKQNGSQLEALFARSAPSSTWHAISACCVNLKVLDLSWAILPSGFTEYETNALCKLPSCLRKLEEVCLPTATDKILGQFARFCSQLRDLKINAGHQPIPVPVSDAGIKALAEGCSKLQVLVLHFFDEITVSSMRFLAFHCPDLRTLDLHKAKLIDDEAVAALFPRLSSSLQVLFLDPCPKISRSTLKLLREKASNLRSVTISPGLYRKERHGQIKRMKAARPWVTIKTTRSDCMYLRVSLVRF